MFAPYVEGPETSRDMITTFGGYNHNLRNADGLPTSQWGGTPPMEWYDEENLCTDHFPVMSPATVPTMVKDGTAMCGCTSFTTIDGEDHVAYVRIIDAPPLPPGIGLCIDYSQSNVLKLDASYGLDTVRQFVLNGTYLLVFPDKKYININDMSDKGDIEEKIHYGGTLNPDMKNSSLDLKFTPCDASGNSIVYVTSTTAPANPSDGDLWLDTSESPHIFKRYSSAYGMWVGVSDVYVFVSENVDDYEDYPLSDYYAEGQSINISFTQTSLHSDPAKEEVALALNGSHIVQKITGGGIVIIGAIEEPFTTSGGADVTRLVPDMDYVIECNNRIWGCKFGVVDGKNINELYCSKLGDFKTWEAYEGLSTDSWRGSVGSDGQWTGAIAYNGYPTFFKENSIHKIYISSTGAHQVVMTSADGIARGSWRSPVIINGVLFYLSHFGVMAYSGTLPTKISEQMPYVLYNGVGGGLNKFYYLSAKSFQGSDVTFVYDTELQVWHKLTPHRASMYAPARHRLMYEEVLESTANIKEIETRAWEMEEVYEDWYAVSGVIGFAYPDNKYLSRFVFRIDLSKDSWCEMFIEYDSDGQWHSKGRMYRPGLQSFVLPVMPRRCDHCRIKLVGHGDFRLYSISKVLEVGSDY